VPLLQLQLDQANCSREQGGPNMLHFQAKRQYVFARCCFADGKFEVGRTTAVNNCQKINIHLKDSETAKDAK
jgi:hypothetical protein